MAFKVESGRAKEFRRIVEISDAEIASVTQKGPDFPGVMVMVHGERLDALIGLVLCSFGLTADCTPPILRPVHGFVFSRSQSVTNFSMLMTALLSPFRTRVGVMLVLLIPLAALLLVALAAVGGQPFAADGRPVKLSRWFHLMAFETKAGVACQWGRLFTAMLGLTAVPCLTAVAAFRLVATPASVEDGNWLYSVALGATLLGRKVIEQGRLFGRMVRSHVALVSGLLVRAVRAVERLCGPFHSTESLPLKPSWLGGSL